MEQVQKIRQSLLSENHQLYDQTQSSYLNNLPTIDGSNIIQRFLFTWLHPFLKYSSKQGVSVQSMPLLPKRLSTSNENQRLKKFWDSLPKNSWEGWRLIKAISLCYRGQIIGLFAFLMVTLAINLIQPIMTFFIIDYIQNHQGDLSYGIILLFLSFLIQILNKLCLAQYTYRFTFMGIRWCNSLSTMIYYKSLRYSTLASKQFSQAQIINLSQTDAQQMTSAGQKLSAAIYGPIQIIFALIMMYYYVGISCLSGIFAILSLLVANYFLSRKVKYYHQKALKAKDERMKITNQMLDIIRFIKISTIEKFFFNKLQEKRKIQLSFYRRKELVFAFTMLLYYMSCPLLLCLTFITYVQLGNQLSSQTAFTIMMLGNIIQSPIYSLPKAISSLIKIMVSIKRIQKFLEAENLTNSLVSIERDSHYAIRIQNGNFFWPRETKQKTSQNDKKYINQSKNQSQQFEIQQKLQDKNQTKSQNSSPIHILKDINLSIVKGRFVMVIGDIGSGKSSLLLAILNEMINSQGSKVYLSGSVAYSPQKPWIMSKSIKENITFNLPYDQEKFKRVIHHSSLQQDLTLFPHRQQTEIGEKGINISGGQKARLSLARALYSENDIYFFDDILSAVDVHVGDFLVKQTFKKLLKGKTIVMPTHALRYIQQADEIIMMSKGQIVRKGSYHQVLTTKEFQQLFSYQEHYSKQNQNKYKSQEKKDMNLEPSMIIDDQIYMERLKDAKQQILVKDINRIIIDQLILPEDKQKGKISLKVMGNFIKNSGGIYKFLFPVLISMTSWVTCRTLASIFIQKKCQNPTENQQLLLFILFILLSNIFILVRAITMVISTTNHGKKVHDQLIKSLLYASLSNFFNRVPMGRILNRLSKDLRQIDQDIIEAVSWSMVCFFRMLSALVICVYASSIFAVIPMIIVTLLSYQIRKYYMKSQREVIRFQKTSNSPVVSGFVSTINGLSSIRAYKAEEIFFETQMINTDTNKKVRLTKSGLQNWFCNILTFLSFLVNMPCIAYCMFGNNNPSLAGLLMVYALGLCQGMTNMTLSGTYFQTKMISMERIYTFMGIQPENGYRQYCSKWSSSEEGGKQVITQGTIQFYNLNACYRPGLPDVLMNISCRIQAGQKIGIVGRTGAGKTTIINTFLRIAQISAGKLFIDGKDIESFGLKDLRSSITMIDQQPTLIKSTFRQNLDIVGKYGDQQLEQILQQCNLYERIQEKGGIHTNVSNVSLSAGEKQLLCICRAFLKNSGIVLIDQATANIDVKNDAIIQKVISSKFKNSTVITIAHRLSTIQNSDKIMVLQKGQLIEFGRPSELKKKGGFFAEMLNKNTLEMLS